MVIMFWRNTAVLILIQLIQAQRIFAAPSFTEHRNLKVSRGDSGFHTIIWNLTLFETDIPTSSAYLILFSALPAAVLFLCCIVSAVCLYRLSFSPVSTQSVCLYAKHTPEEEVRREHGDEGKKFQL
ncbi:hypothetical protein OJAV_G00203720 [Oryzias javanicus]|uniref:Uncharacterized protein n=1 Tax=Oryzias javanicus TaxID=123683 RepID=A0A437C5J6_ORYJA|nr:hypothetical protein OJAV_G00203720 [Oryzias javanicus]